MISMDFQWISWIPDYFLKIFPDFHHFSSISNSKKTKFLGISNGRYCKNYNFHLISWCFYDFHGFSMIFLNSRLFFEDSHDFHHFFIDFEFKQIEISIFLNTKSMKNLWKSWKSSKNNREFRKIIENPWTS